jgi:alkylhydroperoxidase family enzyme
MAWIKVIAPEESQGELLEQYDRMRDPAGNVANILQLHRLNPTALMFARSELSRAQREMIAVVVSKTNGCHY